MSIILSYIIPVYNGEKYLSRCLDSLYRQDLSNDEFEVICIDDCSKDNSVILLRNYAKKCDNVRLILHDNNRHTGTSCNEGVETAQGEYIWIVGQDDWLQDGWGKKLVDIAEKDNLDVLPFNYNRVNSIGDRLISQKRVFCDSPIISGQEYIRTYFHNTVGVYLLGYEWRAIFRRQYLMDKSITFPENVIFEDTTFLFKGMWCAERIKSIDEYIYNYRLNDHSVTDYEQRYKGHLTYEYAFKTSAELLALADTIDDAHVSNQLQQTAIKSMMSFAYKVIPMSNQEKNIFYSNVEQEWNDVKELSSRMPIMYRLLVHPKIGKMVTKMLKPLFVIKHKFVKHTYINH